MPEWLHSLPVSVHVITYILADFKPQSICRGSSLNDVYLLAFVDDGCTNLWTNHHCTWTSTIKVILMHQFRNVIVDHFDNQRKATNAILEWSTVKRQRNGEQSHAVISWFCSHVHWWKKKRKIENERAANSPPHVDWNDCHIYCNVEIHALRRDFCHVCCGLWWRHLAFVERVKLHLIKMLCNWSPVFWRWC